MSVEEAIRLAVDQDMEQLIHMQEREELEEVYGMPVIVSRFRLSIVCACVRHIHRTCAVHPRVRAVPAAHRRVPVLARVHAHPRVGVPPLAAVLPSRLRTAHWDILEPPASNHVPPCGRCPPLPLPLALTAHSASHRRAHDCVRRPARRPGRVLHGLGPVGRVVVNGEMATDQLADLYSLVPFSSLFCFRCWHVRRDLSVGILTSTYYVLLTLFSHPSCRLLLCTVAAV